MKTLNNFSLGRLLAGITLMLVLGARFVTAQTPMDEESPWPRIRSTNGNKVTLYLPQVERWTSNSFTARAAVEVKPAGAKTDLLGVVWFEASGTVDQSNRLVRLDHFEVTKARFPDAADKGSNAMAIVREVVPAGVRTVSLDYLITTLGFERAAARRGSHGLKHVPPEIIWATNRSVLVLIDGDPILRAVTNTTLERVVNTPALLLFEKQTAKFYLNGQDRWFAATSINGPWSLAQDPPSQVAMLAPPSTNQPPGSDGQSLPKIIVRTNASELLTTSGFPDFRPIRGTGLQYAADTDSQLFFHTADREAYLLLSGRWFKAKALQGPWSYVAPHELPPDFARIPPNSPQGIVLASVPETPQAELALLANSVPTTATVNRREARIELSYDGQPKFKTVEGTSLTYAANANIPVIRTGDQYYAVDDGVWFVGATPNGPWQVATEVPEEIYIIPPGSPVYYATFANVYQVNGDEVEVGYTPGYQGAYEDDGTVVYGTGYSYEPWCEDAYYGWGWSWGYSYVYVPWYQWWVWRPWWNDSGGLRAAVIENIYDRWQGRNGVSHYDRTGNTSGRARNAGSSGYPAMYGRFTGANRPAALPPPANALALNPYARPQSSVRSGEVPRGAQLLSSVRQAPGGGRDLYASPDGSIYRRAQDGWYRREAGGKWNFAAPLQSAVQDGRVEAAKSSRPADAVPVNRPESGRNVGSNRGQALGNRVPDSGIEPRAQQIADLEREYYARSLAQARMQRGGGARIGRAGGRR
jgi:hypothetical protein